MLESLQPHLIIGFGLTGRSVVRYLAGQNHPCTIYDDQPHRFTEYPIYYPNMTYCSDIQELIPLQQYRSIIVSPGIPETHPLRQRLQDEGLQTITDIDLFLQQVKGTIIGITGSNGKSTVTRWLEYVLQHNGKKATAVGNIGEPVLNHLGPENSQDDYWIMELSSFQIELTAHLRADVASVITVSTDHMDRHPCFDSYRAIKQQLLSASQNCYINRDDPLSYLHSTNAAIKWQSSPSFGLSAPHRAQDYGVKEHHLVRGKHKLIAVDKLSLIGQHNLLNALLVWMFARFCGLDDRQIATTIGQWQGLDHRFQVITKKHGVTWINDSKSTNVGSMEVAIKSCAELTGHHTKNIHLIVGGQSKKADFSPIVPILKKHIQRIYLFGEDADSIKKQWQSQGLEMHSFQHLSDVINACQKKVQSGDYVLFSPGCASFDQFTNYQHRGETFIQLVT